MIFVYILLTINIKFYLQLFWKYNLLKFPEIINTTSVRVREARQARSWEGGEWWCKGCESVQMVFNFGHVLSITNLNGIQLDYNVAIYIILYYIFHIFTRVNVPRPPRPALHLWRPRKTVNFLSKSMQKRSPMLLPLTKNYMNKSFFTQKEPSNPNLVADLQGTS